MKALKLFPKVFCYTLLLMAFIVAAALGSIYLASSADLPWQQTSIEITPIHTLAVGIAESSVPAEELVENIQLIPAQDVTSLTALNASTAVAVPAMRVEEQAISTQITRFDSSSDTVNAYTMVRLGHLVGDSILGGLPLVMGLCLVLAVLCALLFTRLLVRPIHAIATATEAMARLEPEAVCKVDSGDEIGMLAQRVNYLYQSLQTTIRGLEEERESAQAAERSKVDFLRAASHELKTPVTALSATLENMSLKIPPYTDYDIYLPKCQAMAWQMGEMVREILDTSRLEGQLEEGAEALPLAQWLEDECAPYQLIANSKGQDFSMETSFQGTAALPPKRFTKVVSNLLGNAVAYTPVGGTISVTLTQERLTVENSCTPISAEDLEQIFQPFYRPDWSRDRAAGGNGLGLYIVATILNSLSLDYTFRPNSTDDGMIFTLFFNLQEEQR